MASLPGFATNFPAGHSTLNARGGSFAAKASTSSGASPGQSNASVPQFDVFEWHPAYQSCQRFFVDHAQHDDGVQAVAALVNICLPFQWMTNPIHSSSGSLPRSSGPTASRQPWPHQGPVMNSRGQPFAWVSLVPFVRRLVITGMDKEGIMHGFFGDDWTKGMGPVHERERRNYLFTAKSVGWAKAKCQYGTSPHESVPFLKPLQDVRLAEIEGAEETWSQWLAMEDWMLGARAPQSVRHKDEVMVVGTHTCVECAVPCNRVSWGWEAGRDEVTRPHVQRSGLNLQVSNKC